jgi:uncharacterized membrane protein YphA (DoxX/SURF4 family)
MERCRDVGFQPGGKPAYLNFIVCFWRQGDTHLQRLFSTFPGGRPGIGLLILRASVGFTASATGASYLSGHSNSALGKWLLGAILIAGGVAMAAGFFTPFAALLVGLCFFGVALSWFPTPSWGLDEAKLLAVGMIVTVVALALLGPGAFSLDGRLFGRREIVIPPSPRPPES